MLSVGYLFEETLINESIFSDTKDALSKYFGMSKVQDFIDISKKVVKDGIRTLSIKEQTVYRGLFDDPSVKDYISAARRAGERDGWIKGGIGGGLIGGATGSATGGIIGAASGMSGGGTFGMFVTLGLLGAAAGGAAIGWTYSRVKSLLSKWQAEDDVVVLGRVGGKIGQTTPIVKSDI